MFARRQRRLRVLEVLEGRVRQFRAREELWPLRVPVEPLLFADVVEEALGEESRGFDIFSLRARTVLSLEWNDGSRWDAWVIVLPSGRKVYCDTGHEETRVLASGGRNVGDESDRVFLQLLAESAGGHFGIEMAGGAPSRVRSSIDNRPFLVDLFVNLFEVSSLQEGIRADLATRGVAPASLATPGGRDFQTDVEQWLEHALQ